MYRLSDYHFRELVTSGPDETAFGAAVKMDDQHVGCVLVTSRNKILGIATRYDFVHSIIAGEKDPKKTKIKEIMHASPITIEANATPIDALRKMVERKVERLVVKSAEKIYGVISLEDVVGSLEAESLSALSREKYDQIFDMVKKLTPNLLSRYEGEERIELERDLNNEVKALLRLLQEVEVSLRP